MRTRWVEAEDDALLDEPVDCEKCGGVVDVRLLRYDRYDAVYGCVAGHEIVVEIRDPADDVEDLRRF